MLKQSTDKGLLIDPLTTNNVIYRDSLISTKESTADETLSPQVVAKVSLVLF